MPYSGELRLIRRPRGQTLGDAWTVQSPVRTSASPSIMITMRPANRRRGRHVTTAGFKALLTPWPGWPDVRFRRPATTPSTAIELQLDGRHEPEDRDRGAGSQGDRRSPSTRYSHALPTMQTDGDGPARRDPRRSPLDRAEASSASESVPELWLDQDAPADHEGTSARDKGCFGPSPRKEEARSERGSGREWRVWYRIPDSNR